MRWAFTGLLLLVLLSLLAVQATWPGGTSEHARTGVSLSEFQNGLRIDRPRPPIPDTPAEWSRRTVAPPMPAAGKRTAVAAEPGAPVIVAASGVPGGRGPQDTGSSDTAVLAAALVPAQHADAPRTGRSARTPSEANLEYIVAQVASESDRVPPPGPQAAADAPRPADPPAAVAGPDASDPDPGETAAAEQPPLTGLPTAQAAAPATGPAPTQHAEQPRTDAASRTAATAHHGDRISIHYRADDRSRMAAHWLLIKLMSAGLSAVEMHTTVHAIPASTVRYFSPKDAAAAVLLAKALGSNASAWRVEDCSAYRHKPEPGTVQLWPATAERHAK